MYRVSVDDKEPIKGTKYVTYLDPDRDYYKSGYIRYNAKADKDYEYVMELKEDLRVPSKNEVDQIIKDKVLTNDKLVKETVQSWWEEMVPENSWDRYEMSTDDYTGDYDPNKWTKIVNDAVRVAGDRDMDGALMQTYQSFGLATNAKNTVIKELKSRGYNAMMDEAGVGDSRTREGYAPMIVFDSDKSLELMNVREISSNEEKISERNAQRWRSKARQKGNAW